jgi:nitrogen-specific signal transduction histidine kinase
MAPEESWFWQLLDALMKKPRTTHTVPVDPLSANYDSVADLASGIADDFNNILTTVMGACTLIDKDDATKSELLRYVALIRSSAERAACLSDKLMRASSKSGQEHGCLEHGVPVPASGNASAGDKKTVRDIVPPTKKPNGAIT